MKDKEFLLIDNFLRSTKKAILSLVLPFLLNENIKHYFKLVHLLASKLTLAKFD